MLKYGDDQIFSLFDSLLRSIYRGFFFLLYIPDECNGSQFSLLIFRILLSFLLSFYSYLLFWLESMLLSLATHISFSNLLCLLSDLCPTSGSVLLFSVGSYLEGFRHSGMVTISRTDETWYRLLPTWVLLAHVTLITWFDWLISHLRHHLCVHLSFCLSPVGNSIAFNYVQFQMINWACILCLQGREASR